MTLNQRTPLYTLYHLYGAKVVDFAGFDMPVQFSGIMKEHIAVRTAVGLFDVSHMGEIELAGPGALSDVQKLITNDASRLTVSQAMYSPMCNEHGGTVDDILVYRLAMDRFLLVVNASNRFKDLAWIESHAKSHVIDHSDDVALLALQGPKALDVVKKVIDKDLSSLPYYGFDQDVRVNGHRCLISRTGYTGEDGFELYLDAKDATDIFVTLLEAGQSEGIVPAGLGARDTLRLEARLPLYGHELTDDISPLEAGLSSFVKFDAKDFIGKEALLLQKQQGLLRKAAGIILTGRSIAREHAEIFDGDQSIGYVTSGTYGPTLQKSIALALVNPSSTNLGHTLEVDVRGKKMQAEVVKTPFYRRMLP